MIEENYFLTDEHPPEINRHCSGTCCPPAYELKPAAGCEVGCTYCYVYSFDDYSGFLPVKVFNRYPEFLSQSIDSHKKMGEDPLYYLSPRTDIFQKPLLESGVAESTLEVLVDKKARFNIVTKGMYPGDSIMSLLRKAGENATVIISYGMKNEEHARIIEPNAPRLSKRRDFARECYESGIETAIALEPILPFKDLSFTKYIMEDFTSIGINHFPVEFASLGLPVLERMIEAVPDLAELRDIFYSEEATRKEYSTGAYGTYPSVVHFSPPDRYLADRFLELKDYACELDATISVCQFFVNRLFNENFNEEPLKKGFLCFLRDTNLSKRLL